jgi:hypothetical protein
MYSLCSKLGTSNVEVDVQVACGAGGEGREGYVCIYVYII